MFLRVVAFLFLFLIRLRFPHWKFVAEVIRKRQGQNTVKKHRILEKFGYLLWKVKIDLEFLVTCNSRSGVLQCQKFRVATKYLESSRTYQQCQFSLLHRDICQRKSNIRVLRKEFDFIRYTLQTETSFFDFAYVHSLFQDRIIRF